MRITIHGNNENTGFIAQQIAWLGCTLRTSQFKGVQYIKANARVTDYIDGFLQYDISFAEVNTTSKITQEPNCWHMLVGNAVVALGFPTPERTYGKGIELPLDIMAALGGVPHVTKFEGGVVLKGVSCAFIPVARHEASVQWHMIQSHDDERLTYQDILIQCPHRLKLEDLDFESIYTTRAFLGWCVEAYIRLGTEDGEYEKLHYTSLKEAGRDAYLTGGSAGFSKIITASINLTLGPKDGKFHHVREGKFRQIVGWASKTPVLLFDPDASDRRGWMVPASDVILHIIQHRVFKGTYMNKAAFASPLEYGQDAGAKALLESQSTQLTTEADVEDVIHFKEVVKDLWLLLEGLQQRTAEREAAPGTKIPTTLDYTLRGWEYRALVDENAMIPQSETTIMKTSGGWPDLVNGVSAIVLFASGFGDVIKPAASLKPCQSWSYMPKEKDYMAIGTSMLEMFYETAGCVLTKKYITRDHLQWHQESQLFDPPCEGSCKCYRLQELIFKGHFTGPVRLPENLNQNRSGAVMFGKSGWKIPSRKNNSVKKEKTIYSQSNVPLNICGNGDDFEQSTTVTTWHEPISNKRQGKQPVLKQTRQN